MYSLHNDDCSLDYPHIWECECSLMSDQSVFYACSEKITQAMLWSLWQLATSKGQVPRKIKNTMHDIVACQGCGVSGEHHLPSSVKPIPNHGKPRPTDLTTKMHTWGGPGTPQYKGLELYRLILWC